MKRLFSFLILFLLVVPPLIFFTDLTRNPYYFQIVLVNAGTVILWMLWLYNGIANKKLACPTTPLDIPMWSFLAVATLSWAVMFVINLPHPYMKYGVYNEGLKRWLFLLVNSILVYYMAVNFIDDSNRRRMILAVLWTGFIASVYGILQYFGIELIWPHVLNPYGTRSVSTFGNPNFLSPYLVMLFPLLFVYYIQAANAAKRFFYLLFFGVYLGVLICTLTRSSWLGFASSMAVTIGAIAIFERQLLITRWKHIVIPIAVSLLIVFFWPKSGTGGGSVVMDRIAETAIAKKTYYGSWHQRRLIWSCAWHMVMEYPALGRGWGCFELFYPSYQGRHLFMEAYVSFRTHANNAHNEMLEIWSQTGIAGFGVYLWLLFTLFSYALFLVKNLTGEKKLLAIALTASVVGMLTDNLLNVSLHFAIPAFLYWWNIGLLAGLGVVEKKTINIGSTAARGAVIVLIIFGGALVVRYAANFAGEIHYFSGFKHSKRDNLPAATAELEAAHRLQRLEVNNNYELANAYARTQNREKALEMYKESLRANAGYDEIYFNLATVLAQSGKITDATIEYTRSIYINPLSPESYNALGSIFLQSPELYARADVELFKQCLHFFPRNKEIWNNLGYLYTRLDRNEEALDAYKKAYEIDPDFELAKKNLKITLARLGRNDGALNEIENLFRAVEADIVSKNWQAALSRCEKLVSLAPGSFKAHFYLGNIYFTLGRTADAFNEYKTALSFDPKNTSVMVNMGLVYYETKQYEAARQVFQQVLGITPDNAFAKDKLQQINAMPVTK